MPVTELLVEGKLDQIIFTSLFEGKPTVRQGGSKNALRPKVVAERTENKKSTLSYVRDRDFDFDPPEDRSCPAEHSSFEGAVVGWFWCRHEMENYLLDPAIVIRALECDESAYRAALIQSAGLICDYQAARSALGFVRRNLPPNYDLKTRHHDCPDDKLILPSDLTPQGASSWACTHAAEFRARVCPQLEVSAVDNAIAIRRKLFLERSTLPEEILIWFAGKDIFAALAQSEWMTTQKLKTAGDMRTRLRDWITENPSEAMDLLPEWKRFAEILNAVCL